MAAPWNNDSAFFGCRTGFSPVWSNASALAYQEEQQRELQRQQEKERKRLRQKEIADMLSDLAAEEYGEDVLDAMIDTEIKTIPDVESIDMQTEIQWYMRPYIMDFLIEAHAAFGLLPETLFLTINILDRYCSKRIVYRRHYQLVGCTALWIACKYGECPRAVPHLRELAGMCCGLYDEDMFLQMERHVMATLDWYLGGVTVDAFLRLALEGRPYDHELEHMAFYVAEMATFHRDFVSTRPSDVAKAALYLAQIVLDRPPLAACHWAAQHDGQVLVALSQLLNRPSAVLHAKYKPEAKGGVSILVENFLARHAAIARAQAGPPTPPATATPTPEKDAAFQPHQGPFATPQKNGHLAHVQHGCLTPPITPESESFAGPDAFRPGPHTPMHPHGPSGLQQQQHCAPPPPPVYYQPVAAHPDPLVQPAAVPVA